MIVIAYDGSEDAQRAIDAAAELFSGAALVLCASNPAIEERAAEHGIEDEDAARAIAEEGAERARSSGLDAAAHVEDGGGISTVAHTIVDVAGARGARAIVVGRRGRSKLQSAVLGSVSSAVLEHTSLPVIVVPHPKR
jgi:nucleotide-binding universal stress UspA family protein